MKYLKDLTIVTTITMNIITIIIMVCVSHDQVDVSILFIR